MEAITEILDYANTHGVWPVLFLGLLLFGLPWILKRDKAQNEKVEALYKERLTDLEMNQKTTQEMALAFNDTVNEFNNVVTREMKNQTEQMAKISMTLDGVIRTLTSVADVQMKMQGEFVPLQRENIRLHKMLEETNDLIERVVNSSDSNEGPK